MDDLSGDGQLIGGNAFGNRWLWKGQIPLEEGHLCRGSVLIRRLSIAEGGNMGSLKAQVIRHRSSEGERFAFHHIHRRSRPLSMGHRDPSIFCVGETDLSLALFKLRQRRFILFRAIWRHFCRRHSSAIRLPRAFAGGAPISISRGRTGGLTRRLILFPGRWNGLLFGRLPWGSVFLSCPGAYR